MRLLNFDSRSPLMKQVLHVEQSISGLAPIHYWRIHVLLSVAKGETTRPGNSRCWLKGPDKGSTNFIGVIPTSTFHVGIA